MGGGGGVRESGRVRESEKKYRGRETGREKKIKRDIRDREL